MTRRGREDDRSVLVADGNGRLGHVLAQLLEDEPGIDFHGVCETREEVLTVVGRRRPDVVLVSEALGTRAGSDVCRDLRRAAPGTLLLLWSHDPAGRLAADLDADALLDRGMTFRELVRAVRRPRSYAAPPPPRAVPHQGAEPTTPLAPASELGLSCETCDVQEAVPTADMASAVEQAKAFFAAHDRCATSIDLTDRRAAHRPS